MTETNLEHYKKELGKIFYEGCFNPAAMFAKIKTNYDSNIRSKDGHTYADDILDWMSQPYKEPILDDAERKYLQAIIKPFKNKVTGITKIKDDYKCKEGKRYIRIIVRQHEEEYINLPWFEANQMYKGMKENREYTLEELGL